MIEMIEKMVLSDELGRLYDKMIQKIISYDDVILNITEMIRKRDISDVELELFISLAKQKKFYLIAGRVLNLCGWFSLEEYAHEKALNYFEEALELLNQIEDTQGIISNHSGMMCAYFHLGMYDESISWGMNGLKLAEESQDDYLLMQALANIGLIYFDLERYKDVKRTLEAIRKLREPKEEGNKITLDLLATKIYLVFGDVECASYYIERAYTCAMKVGYYSLMAETLRIRAMVCYKLDNYEQCLKNFKASIAISKKYGHLQQLVFTYYEWGKIEHSLNHTSLAELSLLKAYSYNQLLKSSLLNKKICQSLVQLYKKMGDFKQALEYYERNEEFECKMELRRTEFWSRRLLREKTISEAKIFKSLYDELQMICEIGQSFTQKLDYNKLIMNVKDELSKLMKIDFLLIAQFDSSKDTSEYVTFIASKDGIEKRFVPYDDGNNLGAYCINQKKDLIIFDLNEENEQYHLKSKKFTKNENGVKSLICCPLIFKDEVRGYISVQSIDANQYSDNDVSKLNLLASYIVIALENAKMYHQTNYLACYDRLTGLLNRFEIYRQANDRFQKKKERMCVMMFDIDYFKKINDTFGHQVGDEVLRRIGELLRKYIDDQTLIGRYGGEEFISFFIQKTRDEVFSFADRLRQELEGILFDFLNEDFKKVTASFGIYEYDFEDSKLEDGITIADNALYQSKNQGRNQITIFNKKDYLLVDKK